MAGFAHIRMLSGALSDMGHVTECENSHFIADTRPVAQLRPNSVFNANATAWPVRFKSFLPPSALSLMIMLDPSF